jgi:hypothetical protein
MREVAGSVAALISGATSRTPLTSADGKSGAVLESVVIDGDRYVLKTFDLTRDWLLRASGDAGCRAVALWEHGLYDAVPDRVDHTVVGAARDPAAGPYVAALLMRDVSPWLVPEDAPITLADHRAYLDAMAAVHARFWGWRDTYGFTPMSTRYVLLAPLMAETEAVRGGTDEVPLLVGPGWAALAAAAPDLAAVVAPLLADPAPLCEALARTPETFLPGDWKLGNMGRHPDGRTILLDWDRPGAGPATYDLTWYVAVNCDRMPESKEAALDTYRAALEAYGVDTAPWWDTQVTLALLGAFLQLGWSKADQPAELDWWRGPVLRAATLL